MHKKLFISFLIIAIFAVLALLTKPSAVKADEASNAYHVEGVISEKFNKETLDSSWKLNGATKEHNYYGLHCVSPVGYGSGPIINAVRLANKTRINFTIYPNSGRTDSNISFNIGMKSPTGEQKEPDVDARLQLWDAQVVFLDYQHNLAVNEANINNDVLRGFSGLYSDLLRTDVSIVIERKGESLTEMYVEYRRNGAVINTTRQTPFKLFNPRYPDGYCGFFWDCVEMDLTNFEVYNDDVLVFQDDFSKNTLTYPSSDYTKGNFHVNSVLTEKNVYISNISSILMDAGNDSIINSYKLAKLENVSNPYELKYSVKLNELNDNSFVGFGFGLAEGAETIDKTNAIGFIKNDDLTADVVVIRDGKVDMSNNYQIAMAKLKFGVYQNVTVSFDYANNAYLSIGGVTYKFSNINYYGQFGIGLVDLQAAESSSFELNQFELNKNEYPKCTSEDASNDFAGKKESEDTGWDEPYINSQKFFLGNLVSLDEDWSTDDVSLAFTNIGPYSAFGVRREYSEFILEFDVEMYSHQRLNYWGVSFGRKSVVDVLTQASTTSNSFLFRCDVDDFGNISTAEVIYGSTATFENGLTTQASPINVYAAGEHKYHMMVVGKNRTIYVYCKDVDAPDTELATPIAVIVGANIDGYVSIVGTNNTSFGVTNYKIVNLSDDCKVDSNIALRETFDSKNSVSEKLSVDAMSKVKDGKLEMNNSAISTIIPHKYEIIRFTTYDLEDSLQIMFSQGKKLIVDARNNQMVVVEDGVKTKYDVSDINLKNIKGKRFEIVIQGDKLSVGYKGYYDPQDKLSVSVFTHTFASELSRDSIVFSANGKVTLDDLYIFALDNSYRSEKLDYEIDPDNLNFWVVKPDFDPSKVYKKPAESEQKEEPATTNAQGCNSSVSAITLASTLVLSLAALVLARKKEEE